MKGFKKHFAKIIGLLGPLIIIFGFIILPSSNQNALIPFQKNINLDSTGLAFICHITHSTVTVIDLKTNKIIDTLQAEAEQIGLLYLKIEKLHTLLTFYLIIFLSLTRRTIKIAIVFL